MTGRMSDNPADSSLREQLACPFCDRIEFNEYEAVARNRQGDATVAAFEPLNPVVPGHRLFLPVEHVASAIASPDACALAMREAAAYARWKGADCNLITSSGTFATQTVQHLHVHYVPRTKGDGLSLPWTAPGSAAEPCGDLRRQFDAMLGEYAFEIWPLVSAGLEAARADERAKTLAMAAACAECFSDEAADDLWERAERAGWKVP